MGPCQGRMCGPVVSELMATLGSHHEYLWSRSLVETLLAPTGRTLWVAQESDLDAVTALSGSGPAYVFFFIEAMVQAGVEMGLSAAQAFAGVAAGDTVATAVEQVAKVLH